MSLRSGAARAVGVGPTASPGLSTIQVFETNTLFAVHNVRVRAYTENTDDGFGCLDWDRLEYWWEDR